MNRYAVALAALACTLAVAGPARAEKRIYGLSQTAAGNTVACSGEASLALGAYLLYETGKPVEEAVLLARQSASGLVDPAAAERRIRDVYSHKPPTSAQWGRHNFESCLKAKKVPLADARVGNCYLLTFYLASVVPVHRLNGHTPKTMMDLIVAPTADPKFREKLLPIVEEYYARGSTDPRKNNVADLERFLHCAAPGQAQVSEAPAG